MRISGVVSFLLVSLASFAGTNGAPFSLTIAGPEAPIKNGSKINVHVRLTNTSVHEITLFDTNRDCDYRVEVSINGNPARETEYKRALRCDETMILERNVLVTLKPQQSTEDNIMISNLYDMTTPGTYLVRVMREIPKNLGRGTVQSNSITIAVGSQ